MRTPTPFFCVEIEGGGVGYPPRGHTRSFLTPCCARSEVLKIYYVGKMSSLSPHPPPALTPFFIPSKVLKLKTVVLVTHQVAMSAPYADRIVVVDSDGTIKEQGTYEVPRIGSVVVGFLDCWMKLSKIKVR